MVKKSTINIQCVFSNSTKFVRSDSHLDGEFSKQQQSYYLTLDHLFRETVDIIASKSQIILVPTANAAGQGSVLPCLNYCCIMLYKKKQSKRKTHKHTILKEYTTSKKYTISTKILILCFICFLICFLIFNYLFLI